MPTFPQTPSVPTARTSLRGIHALLAVVLAVSLGACDPDVAERQLTPDPASGTTAADGDGSGGVDGGGTGSGGEQPAPAPADGFSFVLPVGAVVLVEGGDAVELPIGVARAAGNERPVTLAAEDDAGGLVLQFGATRLGPDESETTLGVSLPIGERPRLPGTRTLRLVATDGSGARLTGEIVLEITPTDRPDIYLLAGQSNMVGSTREDLGPTRDASPGGPDEPNARIFQLNATINDGTRFPTPAAYTDPDLIADPDRRIVSALDPLHDRNTDGANPKSGTTIGLGLTFAKQALADTSADIVLVPAAWSDTGFCRRDSSRFDGATGWNATTPASDVFAGTLLHDRAVARTDLAIAETGGILRGILWHQGEADSDDDTCARAYDDNLRRMVESLRANIAPDARGAGARGAEARIPFVVGTMSKGSDPRGGALAPFSEIKSRVDAAHRNVTSTVPFSAVVDADDLVPAGGFPCGQGSCIHFGGLALREMGVRYYRQLRGLFDGS